MKETNLIIGKKNTGKTRGILFNKINEYIKQNENLMFLDTKEEYYNTYAQKLQNNGYNVKVINLNDATRSNSWNPLLIPYKLYKSGKIDDAVSLIEELSLSICKEDSHSDPFWENSAANHLTGLILILFKEANENQINISNLGLLLNSSEKELNNSIVIKEYMSNIDPLDPIYVMSSGTVFAPFETRASIISVLRQKVNNFLVRENLLNMLNADEINILDNVKKTAIFIITKKDSINPLANVLIHQIANVCENGFTFILDNLGVLKPLNDFENFIENSEIKNFNINVVYRNIDEFEEKYGKYTKSLFKTIIHSSIEEGIKMLDIGTYKQFPTIKQNNVEYFDFEKFVCNHCLQDNK